MRLTLLCFFLVAIAFIYGGCATSGSGHQPVRTFPKILSSTLNINTDYQYIEVDKTSFWVVYHMVFEVTDPGADFCDPKAPRQYFQMDRYGQWIDEKTGHGVVAYRRSISNKDYFHQDRNYYCLVAVNDTPDLRIELIATNGRSYQVSTALFEAIRKEMLYTPEFVNCQSKNPSDLIKQDMSALRASFAYSDAALFQYTPRGVVNRYDFFE